MSESKHTPGKWQVDAGAADGGQHTVNADVPGEGKGEGRTRTSTG